MVIRLHDLTLGYDRHPAVHHLSGCFAEGALTAVVGPNGAGKSTLLKGIVGDLTPLGGRIEMSGGGPVAYLPQQVEIDLTFPILVEEVVILGHWRRVGAFAAIPAQGRARVTAALAAVGLVGFERRRFGSLSPGQRQRVLFARLMVEDGATILLDEPFSGVDDRTATDLMAIMTQWGADGRTVICVLHDLDRVRRHFPQTLVLARTLVAWGETATVMAAPMLARMGQLAEAWDETAPRCHEGE